MRRLSGWKTGSPFQKALLILLFIASFALLGFYLDNMIRWRYAPDPGWLAIPALGPGTVGVLTHNGEAGGLRHMDKILSINGKLFKTTAEKRALIDWGIGHPNSYRIEREGREFELVVPTGTLGPRQVVTDCGSGFLVGILYVCLGLLVFLMKPWHGPSWVFSIMSVLMGLLSAYSASSYLFSPSLLNKVLLITFAFLPAVIIHLAAVFPERRAFASKPLALAPQYLFSTALLIATVSKADRIATVPSGLLTALYLYLLASVLVFLGNTIYSYRTTASAAVRLQSVAIFTGMGLAGLIPLVDGFANMSFGATILPESITITTFILFFPLSVGYAIVRHDLFEIDTVIRRTYGYVLSTAAIVVAYAAMASGFNTVFRTPEISRSPFFTVTFTIVVVLLFRPLQERIQRLVDRVFYRQRYDYRKTIRGVSEAMTSILDAGTIQRTLVGSLTREMFLENGLLLLPAGGGTFRGEAVAGLPAEREAPSLEPGTPVVGHLAAGEPVLRDDLDINPRYELEKAELQAAFERCDSALMFPLRYKEELRGVISLGRKKSGKIFTPEDLDLLQTLANQTAIALENARLFLENIEKGRMEEELKIAHDIQMSMLPEHPPEVAGLEIAARSVPAREVGGDFYDFMRLPGDSEERLGVVIGDVSGKAVSGALVMAASRSIFRVLTGTNPDVATVMNAGNACLLRDVKKGMFVAATYALFNTKERLMLLANAGQPEPLLLRAAAEPAFVETAGDRFPLGIVGAATYEETRVTLDPGDTVIFYSDGVVEAMNGAEELYGFERLIGAVRGGEGRTAGQLLGMILDDVNTFAGQREQHDDLTVVVVRVV